jgi:uncharacterized membrane protein YfcA
MALESLFETGTIAAVVAITVVAGLAHGTIGFGFPVISTPLVALLLDVKTAVLVTVVPNVAVNVISILRGGRWRESIGRHWPVAAAVVAGTLVGTRLLLVAPPEPLKVLLAAMILVYLQQERLRRLDWSWIARAPGTSGIAFGLVGGMLSGAVNVSAPPLIIYFMTLGLAPTAMTQVLNLCFIAGKVTQATNLGLSQAGGAEVLRASLPLTAIAAATVLGGMRIQSRLRPERYRRLMRAVLWAMALLLLAQVGWKAAHALQLGPESRNGDAAGASRPSRSAPAGRPRG